MDKKTVLKNIDNIYTKLNNGYILLNGNGNNKDPYLYHTITADKNYIYYKNFGQYASKNTKSNLKEYIQNYFNNDYFLIIPLKKYYNTCLKFSKYEHIKTNLLLNNPFCFGIYRILKYNNNSYLLYTKNGCLSNHFYINNNKPVFDSLLYVNSTTKNKIKTLVKNNCLYNNV